MSVTGWSAYVPACRRRVFVLEASRSSVDDLRRRHAAVLFGAPRRDCRKQLVASPSMTSVWHTTTTATLRFVRSLPCRPSQFSSRTSRSRLAADCYPFTKTSPGVRLLNANSIRPSQIAFLRTDRDESACKEFAITLEPQSSPRQLSTSSAIAHTAHVMYCCRRHAQTQ
jgi:hypothetical protein